LYSGSRGQIVGQKKIIYWSDRGKFLIRKEDRQIQGGQGGQADASIESDTERTGRYRVRYRESGQLKTEKTRQYRVRYREDRQI